jgi:hypothetical protein
MSMNSGFKEAPPTKNPSTSGCDANSLLFPPFTEPAVIKLSSLNKKYYYNASKLRQSCYCLTLKVTLKVTAYTRTSKNGSTSIDDSYGSSNFSTHVVVNPFP